MDILGVVALGVTLFATMFGVASSIDQAQKSESQFEQQKNLSEKSLDLQQNIANQNFGLQKEQFEYQKQLNELQMRREDTAMQRQVADLKAAGLSPLMAGNGSATGQLISGTAPQMDGSGIMQAMSNMLGIRSDYASRKQAAAQFERQQALQTAQTYSDLISARLNNKKLAAEVESINIANKYNQEHGLRDPSAVNALVDALMSYIDKNNGVKGAIDNIPKDSKEVGDKVETAITELVKDAAQDKIDKTKEMYQSAKTFVSDHTPEPVKEEVKKGIEAAKKTAAAAKAKAKNAARAAYEAYKNRKKK